MLTQIRDLPPGVEGVRAEGTVTGDDYRAVLKPLLADARRRNRSVRLLYRVGPQFERFTRGAAWEDLRLGLEYLHDFERCAVVSDHASVRAASKLAGAIVPCEVHTYREVEREDAVRWLEEGPEREPLSFRLLPECELLLIEPRAEAAAADFEAVRDVVGEWIASGGRVRAVVIYAKELSAWTNPSFVLKSWTLIHDYHRRLERVAVAVGGSAGELISALEKHFANAEVRHFEPRRRSEAISWAAGQLSESQLRLAGRPA